MGRPELAHRARWSVCSMPLSPIQGLGPQANLLGPDGPLYLPCVGKSKFESRGS